MASLFVRRENEFKLVVVGAKVLVLFLACALFVFALPSVLAFDTFINNSNIFVDGSVGIGTSSPERILHVYDGSSGATGYGFQNTVAIENSGGAGINFMSGNNTLSGIVFSNPDDVLSSSLRWNNGDKLLMIETGTSDGEIQFATANRVEAVRIDSDGNVGIGANSPSSKLDVDGNVSITGILNLNSSASPSIKSSGNRLTINEPSTGPYNEAGFVTQFASGSYPRTIFAITDTAINTAFFGLDGDKFTIGSEGNTDIRFRKDMNYSSSDLLNSGLDMMFIEGSNGNVGIGTTSPTQRLDVNGSLNVSGVIYGDGSQLTGIGVSADSVDGSELSDTLTLDANMNVVGGYNFSVNNSDFFVDVSSGNVGIGTHLPHSNLHVAGSAYVGGVYLSEGNGSSALTSLNAGRLELYHAGDDGAYIDFKNSAEDYDFRIQPYNPTNTLLFSGGKYAFLDSDFGIGTSSPSAKLDVNGSDITSGTILDIDASGLVGGRAINIENNDLGHGGNLIRVYTNTSSSESSNMVELINDNPLSDGNVLLHLDQDSEEKSIFVDAATENGTVLDIKGVLKTGNAINVQSTLTTGNLMRLFSTSTGESGGSLGYIKISNSNSVLDGLTIENAGNGLSINASGDSYFGGNLYGGGNVSLNDTLYVDSGKVGVGDDSPEVLLTIQDGDSGVIPLSSTKLLIESDGNTALTIGSGTSSQGKLIFGTDDEHVDSAITYSHDSDEMIFNVNGYNVIYITNESNVGIGVSSPSLDLEVAGQIGFAGDTRKGIVKVYDESTGDVFGIEQIGSPDSEIGVPELRVFTSDAGNAGIGFGKYTNDTAFEHFMVIEQDGSVGINTTSPSYPLEVKGEARISSATDSGYLRFIGSTLQVGDSSGITQIVLNGNGNSYFEHPVGVGLTNPSAELEVAGDAKFGDVYVNNDSVFSTNVTAYNDGYLELYRDANDGAYIDFKNGAEDYDFRIQARNENNTLAILGGNVGIGLTDPITNLEVELGPGGFEKGIFARAHYSGEDTRSGIHSGTGGVYIIHTEDDFNSTTWAGFDEGHSAWSFGSDERLKKDVALIDNALEKVSSIRGVSFDWKEESKNVDGVKRTGVIAQEVQDVMPELIGESPDGYLSVGYSGFTPYLIEAVKELKSENDELRLENDEIKLTLCDMGREEWC